jgi:hypothetical protein
MFGHRVAMSANKKTQITNRGSNSPFLIDKMKVYQTVKNKEQAQEIISEAFKSVADQYKLGIWKNESCKCDCGETTLLSYNAFNDDGDAIYYSIGICDGCGVDDPSTSAVLNIKIS